MACELFVLPYAGAPLRAPGQSSCLEVVFWKATSEYEAHMRGPANARASVVSRRLRPRHRPHFVEPWTQYLMRKTSSSRYNTWTTRAASAMPRTRCSAASSRFSPMRPRKLLCSSSDYSAAARAATSASTAPTVAATSARHRPHEG